MNAGKLTIGVVLLGLLIGQRVLAEGDVEIRVASPDPARPADPAYAPQAPVAAPAGVTASPSDATVTPIPVPQISEPCPCPEAGPKPWKLPQPCMFQRMGIDMGGWVQQGITFNPDDPVDRFNGPLTTNDRANEYQLNQAWLYFVRPTKTDGCGWDLGGRVDVVYGTDWRFGQSTGLEDVFDSANNFYGLILPQFYAEVAYNDLTLKVGHFATMTSLEVIPAPLNFFYSHSYLMAGYFDPLLVTGFQADYKANDNWTIVGGMNNGWEKFRDPDETYNFLGGVKWASDSKRTSLSVMVDTGTQTGFMGNHVRTSVISVLTHQFNDRLFYGGQVTVGEESHGSFVEPGDDAQWYGMEHLLTYKLNAKWSAGLRYEWVRDEDGARIAGIGNLLGTDRGWRGLPGFTGSFQDVSLGLNWRPNPNLVFRPEVRWDWYDGPANTTADPPQLPFDHFTDRNQFTMAMDLVVTF